MAMKRPEVNFSYFELQRFQAVETCPKNGCSVTLRFALFGGWKNDKRKGLSSNDPFFTCNVSFREGNNIPQMVVKDGVFLLMTQNLQLEIFGLWKNFEFSKLKTASFSQALRAGQVTSEISQDLLQRTERSKSQQKNTKYLTGWLFQPIWRILVEMGIFPRYGWKYKIFETTSLFTSFGVVRVLFRYCSPLYLGVGIDVSMIFGEILALKE